MNQNRPPQSPAVAAVLTNFENHHRRQTSEVQSKVAFLNSLSRPGTPSTPVQQPQTGVPSSSAALQRALLGREEAESALSSANSRLYEAQARERKISERVESLIEDLQSAKERQAHERQVFEKEVRKARKDAFRAGSALVKLQEELKEIRAENSTLRKDIQKEKEAKELAKQEAFERAYTLSGQAEELETLKGKLRNAESERDTARLAQKAEEIVETENYANPPKTISDRPTRDGRSEEQYIGDTMGWIRGVVRGNVPREVDDLKWTLKGLQSQLSGALREVEEQKKNVEFKLIECQGKLCPCRRAEKRGEIYIFDQGKHNRRIERDEAFAEAYNKELERLKPIREAYQAEEAKLQAQWQSEWEADAPRRARLQKRHEEVMRRQQERMEATWGADGLALYRTLFGGSNAIIKIASDKEPAGTSDPISRPARTDVTFSPSTGTFHKVSTPSAPANKPYSLNRDSNSYSNPYSSYRFSPAPKSDESMASESQPEKVSVENKSSGHAGRQIGENLPSDPKGEPQRLVDTKSGDLRGNVENQIRIETTDEQSEEKGIQSHLHEESSSASVVPSQILHGKAEAGKDTEEDGTIITQPLPRPASALTLAGDSPIRQVPISPALSAASSALAPPGDVLFSDDEGDIVPSGCASDAQVANLPQIHRRSDASATHTPLRPQSQNGATVTNITTTTTIVPLRGNENTDETMSPAPSIPGTPISREAALAQIRARRDRARSVVLKETKSAPGTPAKRGLAGGLSVMRSAGPDKGVGKAREFSAHSNAF